MFADVVLPNRRFQVFTYHIPNQLQSQVVVGSPVLIPLGSSVVSGIIVRLVEESALPPIRSPKSNVSFRDILSVDDTPEHSSLDQRLLTLVEKIADYYLAPLPACLRLIVPPRVFKVVKRLHLTEAGRSVLSDASLTMDLKSVLQKLSRGSNGLLRSSLLHALPKATTIVTTLKRKGWIEERSALPVTISSHSEKTISPQRASTVPSSSRAVGDLFEQSARKPSKKPPSLTILSGQLQVLADELEKKGHFGTFQKHIVIGSDHERQQVFHHVAVSLLQRGKHVLFLVPEVHQVELLVKKFRGILSESVEAYHGNLSTRIRAELWERIRQGQVQLVVGTRSALFLPLPNLGLIWVDQEEDASYKDEHLPYYHAGEVARMRGAIEQSLVVSASSCPSLETYSEFREKSEENVQLSGIEDVEVNLIDMRDHASATLLAPPLIDRLTKALNQGQQAIMILNRKGYSPALICRDCGQTPTCETCGVPFRLFQRPSRLVCAYCEYSHETPETCPSCLGTVFRFSGAGTQRLEEELVKLFPSHNVFRFDRDQVKTIEESENVFRRFRQGEIHLLIGTEVLLHQSDPPSAQLIAFPQADLGLHLPDFRSAERTFLLFSKAARLAKSKSLHTGQSGDVFLQTRMPDHHVFQAMLHQDANLFYQQELELREVLAYPPAAHLLLLVVTGVQSIRVQRVIEFLGQQLTKVGLQGALLQAGQGMLGMPMVLGPLSSRKPGHRKKNRTIFLLKTFDLPDTQQRLRKLQQVYAQQFPREPVVLEVHVDPLDVQ